MFASDFHSFNLPTLVKASVAMGVLKIIFTRLRNALKAYSPKLDKRSLLFEEFRQEPAPQKQTEREEPSCPILNTLSNREKYLNGLVMDTPCCFGTNKRKTIAGYATINDNNPLVNKKKLILFDNAVRKVPPYTASLVRRSESLKLDDIEDPALDIRD